MFGKLMAWHFPADMSTDQEYAIHLAREEKRPRQERRIQQMLGELHSMSQTPDGRALLFVEDIHAVPDRTGAEPLSKDDMVYMAKRFVLFREELARKGRTFDISFGWHWTTRDSLETIRESGLMCRTEMKSTGIKPAKIAGSVYGDGIYVANNCETFRRYGDTCLLCLILRGRVSMHGDGQTGYDTVIGNKKTKPKIGHPNNEIVLQRCDQIFPVFIVTDRSEENQKTLKLELLDLINAHWSTLISPASQGVP